MRKKGHDPAGPVSPKLASRPPKTLAVRPGVVYWHSELPPQEAEMAGEYTVEAASKRVPGTLSHRDELWDECYEDLMVQACRRLQQEVARLGGDYAHVLHEAVDSRHDPITGTAWLHGLFTYSLYRRAPANS